MDTVYVHGLTVDTVIGIFDWEREIRQTVVLDVEMAVDISPSA
ncbi:MAG: FolB domain-containing protein, partial [Oceanospirillaceae bacterium]|nr:FolB domain-containing protein [Oceanospirillaceae bacterium]